MANFFPVWLNTQQRRKQCHTDDGSTGTTVYTQDAHSCGGNEELVVRVDRGPRPAIADGRIACARASRRVFVLGMDEGPNLIAPHATRLYAPYMGIVVGKRRSGKRDVSFGDVSWCSPVN